MHARLTDVRTILVTGASSGIGAAVAHRLLGAGHRVVCVALRRGDLDAEFFAYDGKIVTLVPLDLSRLDGIIPALKALPVEWAVVDGLVNCAGADVGGMVPFHEVDPDAVAMTLAVNLSALMLVTRFVLPAMVQRNRGDIVNIGSVLGQRPGNDMCAYTASKFGVHGFSEALRHDLRATQVRVSEVVPGTVRTKFASNRWPGDAARADAFYDGFPMALEPDDIARTVAFILDQPLHVQLASISPIPNLH
jgi:3-hydroxy acid dehydrogenase / malonic semialdehyde reductase